VHVSIGGVSSPPQVATSTGVFHGSVPQGDQIGAVVVSAELDDGTILGPVSGAEISAECANGKVNWNAWVGSS
jgi:hypothetical protein